MAGWRLGNDTTFPGSDGRRGALGISDDGMTVVGWGLNPQGNPEAWLADLTPPVPTGDANGDGHIDGTDYLIWAANFGADPANDPPGSPFNGDFNDDSVVDGLDYLIWAGTFGQGSNDTAAVPEPSALTLLLFGFTAIGLTLHRSRRRR